MISTTITALPLSVIIVLALLLGLIMGSFLAVVVIRLPNNLFYNQNQFVKSLWQNNSADPATIKSVETEIDKVLPCNTNIPLFNAKRSVCIHCQKQLTWFDNIPVISYLFNKGKCRFCQQVISPIYITIELITACLFITVATVCYWQQLSWLSLLSFWMFTSALIALSFIDSKHKILPDEITLPMLWLGLLINLFDTFASLQDSVLGAVVGYLALWLLYHVHFLLTKREGLGYGDFKLTAMIGAWLGIYSLSYLMLIASFLGIVFFIVVKILNKTKANQLSIEREMPFGPFLSIAAFILGLYTLSNLNFL